MLNVSSKKNGFTLIEVLVVITIMGILSSMGVASLRNAVINARIKDSTVNTAAFLERVANESAKLSKNICLKKYSEYTLGIIVADNCNDFPTDFDKLYDSFVIEPPSKFECDNQNISGEAPGSDWTEGIVFKPRIGLSAAPAEGHVCIQYGESPIYGFASKKKDLNKIYTMMYRDGLWSSL